MPASLPNYVRLTVVVAAIGLCLAGCGRKGDLDPPSAMATKNGDSSKATKQPGVVDKPFVLDPLL